MSRKFRDLLPYLVVDFCLVLAQEGTDLNWRELLCDVDRSLIWGSLDAPLGYRTRDDHHDHPAPILHCGLRAWLQSPSECPPRDLRLRFLTPSILGYVGI